MFRDVDLPAAVFQRHRAKLMAQLPQGTAAIIFAGDVLPSENADASHPFSVNSSYYYLTGLRQAGGILWLYPEAPLAEQREVLFIPVASAHQRLWEGWSYSLEEAAAVSGVPQVVPLTEWSTFFRRCIGLVEGIGLDFNEHERQTRGQLATPAHRLARKLQQELPAHRLYRLAPLLYRLRSVKDPEEIAQLQQAIEVTQTAYRQILPMLRAGIYEYEIEAEILRVFVQNRASVAFSPIIAGGPRACVLHYTFNSQPLAEGDLVLIDIGAKLGMYAADLTRTLPVGAPSREVLHYVEWVAEVQAYAQSVLRPGLSLHAWHQTVADYIQEGLIALGLLPRSASPTAYKRYFPHGLGHFLGLDVHDVGYRYEPLEAGCVVTCEPGLYIPEKGIGIRIENDLLVTDAGCENLSADLPDLLGL